MILMVQQRIVLADLFIYFKIGTTKGHCFVVYLTQQNLREKDREEEFKEMFIFCILSLP